MFAAQSGLGGISDLLRDFRIARCPCDSAIEGTGQAVRMAYTESRIFVGLPNGCDPKLVRGFRIQVERETLPEDKSIAKNSFFECSLNS